MELELRDGYSILTIASMSKRLSPKWDLLGLGKVRNERFLTNINEHVPTRRYTRSPHIKTDRQTLSPLLIAKDEDDTFLLWHSTVTQ